MIPNGIRDRKFDQSNAGCNLQQLRTVEIANIAGCVILSARGKQKLLQMQRLRVLTFEYSVNGLPGRWQNARTEAEEMIFHILFHSTGRVPCLGRPAQKALPRRAFVLMLVR